MMNEHRGNVRKRLQNRPDVHLARREQELVKVDKRDPAGCPPVTREAVAIRAALTGLSRPVPQGHEPTADERTQHVVKVIPAIVVVEIELRDSDTGMESDPFVEKSCLILEDGADRQGMRRMPAVQCVAQDGPQHEWSAKQGLCVTHDRMPANGGL